MNDDRRVWSPDELDTIRRLGESAPVFDVPEHAADRVRQYVEVECPECRALVTQNLVTACASVGIEHGRSAGAELLLYLEGVHERAGHAARGGASDG